MQPDQRYFQATKNDNFVTPDMIAYNRRTEFLNNTSMDVWVLDRDNCPIRVPANRSLLIPGDKHGFIIRETHNYFDFEHLEAAKTTIEYISNKNSSQGTGRMAIYDKLCDAVREPTSKGASVTVDYFISFEELRNSQVLHDKTTGYTICINNKHLVINNPESRDAETQGDVNEYITNRPNGVLFEIVDNTDTIRERFTFISNQVIKIPVIKNHSRASGLYVTKVRDYGNDKSEVLTDFFSFDVSDGGAKFKEGEKAYGLFRTKEEAITHGHPENISNARMEELSQQTKLMEHEHRREALRFDTEKRQMQMDHEAALNKLSLEHKQQLNNLENITKQRDEEIAKLKDEIEKRKVVRNDYYDSRSSERKDNSELVKYIPALVVAAIGLIAVMRK